MGKVTQINFGQTSRYGCNWGFLNGYLRIVELHTVHRTLGGWINLQFKESLNFFF